MILEVAEKMRKQYPWSLPHFFQGFCDDWDLKICSDICPDCASPSKLVIEEPIGILMPENHPLASKSTIYRKDIEPYDFLSLNSYDGLTKNIAYFCSKAGFKPNITMYVESPLIMQELLKRNFGIAFAPFYTWHSYIGNGLVIKPVEDMPMRQYVHIVLNDKKHTTRNTQCCYEAIARFYIEYAKSFSNVQVNYNIF